MAWPDIQHLIDRIVQDRETELKNKRDEIQALALAIVEALRGR